MMRGIVSGIGRDSLSAYLGKSLVFAAFVYLAARFGSLFRFDGSSVSLLCLMTGSAVAGLLLLGSRYWPALFLASLFGALATGMSNNAAVLIALGASFGALSAIGMWRYLSGAPIALESLRDLLYLSIFATLGNSTVFACFATAASVGDAGLAGHSIYDTWLLWWVAGVNGVLLLVPLALSLVNRNTAAELQDRWPELLALLVVTTGVSLSIYGNPGFTSGRQNLALQVAIFPLIVWGAVRFSYFGASCVAILVSIVAMTALLFGGVAGNPLVYETALLLQALTAVMVFAGLALCSTLEEKRLAMQVLQDRKQQTQTVLDNLPTLFYIKDLQGRYSLVNKAFASLFGMQPRELIGVMPEALFGPIDAKRFHENDSSVLQTGKNIQFEEAFYAQGQHYVFLSNKFPIHDRNGKLIGICANGTDITSRKRAEADLSAAEAKFRALVESSLAGIFIVQNGIVMYANPELGRMLGYSQGELTGRKLEPLLWIDDRAYLGKHLCDIATRAGEHELLSFRLMHRAGYPIEVEMHSRRLVYDGQVAIFGLILDVRERLRTERQLTLYAKVFENANDAICIIDGADRMVAVNDAFCRITGCFREEVTGKPLNMIEHGVSESLIQSVRKQLLLCGYWQGEFVGQKRNGGHYPAWLRFC